MARHLFLDANIYLSFYLFGKDDLEEMAKVVKLVGDEEITLHTNSHLASEIARNRESKIAEGFTAVKSINFSREYPHYFGDYEELEKLRTKLKEVSLLHAEIIERARSDIAKKTLRADKLINGLLKLGTCVQIDAASVERAILRCDLGDPPGKKGSLGDAIHWQSLLTSNAFSIDIVSLDADFSSALEPKRINAFLHEEWKSKKHGSVVLFRSLSDYFESRFPTVTLSTEFEKDSLVKRLNQSSNFAETHEVIAQLSKFTVFTKAQTRGLFTALLENTQVGWIATDEDVKSFFMTLKDQTSHLTTKVTSTAAELLEVKDDYFSELQF
jgi:hypothetical protein